MKLYSKFQLIITALIVAVVVGTAATFFTITLTKNHAKTDTLLSSEESSSNPKDTASEVSNSEEASDIAEGEVILLQEQSVPGNADSFVLQTAVKSEPVYSAEMQQMYTRDELQNITVYEKCNEAVVNITTEVMAYNWFLEPVPQSGGSGSGSIIDKRGYVVTNVHVISDAYKIYISLYDGSQYEGTVVGVDKESDIAVLKFDPPKNRELQTIPFGDSDSLKVGQKLIAIG
ncbi:MAG: S1C family serine protease, partial [Candidatus Treponema excrementipullorum]|nr:S1C family serine protease [Candidatus Treponema excrementipullorum]